MPRILPTVLIAALLGAASAQAHNETQGAVPLPDERFIPGRTHYGQGMAMAKSNAAFVRFADAHPAWQFSPDPFTGAIHRAWGDGIRITGFP